MLQSETFGGTCLALYLGGSRFRLLFLGILLLVVVWLGVFLLCIGGFLLCFRGLLGVWRLLLAAWVPVCLMRA